MGRWGTTRVGLLAVLATVGLLLAFLPAAALAANPITVNEQSNDEPLEAAGDSKAECISTAAGKGCTLRAAVELANYESREFTEVVTIDLPAETFGNTEEYGTFEIEVGAHIIVVGKGVGQTKIEGGGEEPDRASIFTVDEGGSLTLQNLTLLHGYAESGKGNGGAIDAEGGASVTIEQSAIEHNGADHDGGGVYGGDDSFLHEGASITIKHSTVTDNFAEGSDEGGGNGGGVYGEPGASITIEEESTIAKNTADRNGGGVFAGTGKLVTDTECALAAAKSSAARARSDVAESSGGGDLTIKHSKIEDNVAEGNGRDGGGGGVYVSEGEEPECVTSAVKPATVLSDEGELAIEQSQIEGNNAYEGNGGGVALINFGGCGQSVTDLAVKQSTIAANTAWGEEDDGDGGGIYAATDIAGCNAARSAHSAGKHVKPAAAPLFSGEFGLMVEQSTLANNRAGHGGGGGLGGGIYEGLENAEDPIVNSTIADNVAGDDGGGMYAEEGDLDYLVSDTVSDNESEDGNAGNLATEEFSELDLRNTIVAEEASQKNCEGEIYGEGYNLDDPSESGPAPGIDSCGLSAEDGDLLGVSPGFAGALQNNGGPTETIALASSSPAIGVVPVAGDCEEPSPEGPSSVDQRGEPRPGLPGRGCDVGAYEYQGVVAKAEVKPEEKPAGTPPPKTPAGVLPFKISIVPRCTSKRDITIHIQNVKQFGIVSAVVSVDGKAFRKLTGSHLTTAINLRGLPTGTFTVSIVARQRDGHKLTGKRTYHTCHSKLPGHSYLPL